MADNITESVSDSLETTGDLLPHLPYLLQDLWALGSSVDDIIGLIVDLELPANAQILDLGCGKGALIIQLAKASGFHCFGVDALFPFLAEARSKAEAYGVSHLCHFLTGDICQFTSIAHKFDVVILASLGGIFGSLTKTMETLRTQIKGRGYIIIDDGYLKKGYRLVRKGYQHYKSQRESLKALSAFGDHLLNEVKTVQWDRKINQEYLDVITRRGHELMAQFPGLRQKILSYIEMQKKECNILDKYIEGVIWLFQKSV